MISSALTTPTISICIHSGGRYNTTLYKLINIHIKFSYIKKTEDEFLVKYKFASEICRLL